MSVQFAEYKGNEDHRLMPLNDQGKFAMLYRDDQFQQRLESFDAVAETEDKDGQKLLSAIDMSVIPDAYSSNDPLFYQAITPNLIAMFNRASKKYCII